MSKECIHFLGHSVYIYIYIYIYIYAYIHTHSHKLCKSINCNSHKFCKSINFNKYTSRKIRFPDDFNWGNLNALNIDGSHFHIGNDMNPISRLIVILMLVA